MMKVNGPAATSSLSSYQVNNIPAHSLNNKFTEVSTAIHDLAHNGSTLLNPHPNISSSSSASHLISGSSLDRTSTIDKMCFYDIKNQAPRAFDLVSAVPLQMSSSSSDPTLLSGDSTRPEINGRPQLLHQPHLNHSISSSMNPPAARSRIEPVHFTFSTEDIIASAEAEKQRLEKKKKKMLLAQQEQARLQVATSESEEEGSEESAGSTSVSTLPLPH
jgi:hypothetical protein